MQVSCLRTPAKHDKHVWEDIRTTDDCRGTHDVGSGVKGLGLRV